MVKDLLTYNLYDISMHMYVYSHGEFKHYSLLYYTVQFIQLVSDYSFYNQLNHSLDWLSSELSDFRFVVPATTGTVTSAC